MSDRRFNLKPNVSLNIGSAGEELRKIEAKKDYDFRIVPIEKIQANPMNKYPMEDIEKLYNSIKRLKKLLTPLRVKSSDEIFSIIAGERRYRAISFGIERNDPEFEQFKIGIPCMVEDKSLPEVDEEIQLIVENEERREPNEARKRQMVARLDELYKMKNIETGENKSVTKQIAADLGISERQAQRFNAVNSKLIPKLQEAFDNSKIGLKKAAEFAAMSEETQEMIAELLEEKEDLTKQQLDTITKQAKDTEEKLKWKIEDLSTKSEEAEKNYKDLLKKMELVKEEIKQKNDSEKEIRKQIEEELKNNNPDKLKIEDLEKKMDQMQTEARANEKELDKMKNILEEKENEIKKIQKQEQDPEKKSKGLTSEEKEKLKVEFEIRTAMDEITKKLEQLTLLRKKYMEKYQDNLTCDDFYKNTSCKLEELQSYNK